MEEQKDRMISIGATIGFHLLVVLALLLYTMDLTPITRQAEDLGGVPVMFGNVADAFGTMSHSDGEAVKLSGHKKTHLLTSLKILFL